MAKVFLAFRGHGNVSSADARKIAACADALREACEAAGIESKASVDVSEKAVQWRLDEAAPVVADFVDAPVEEFAVAENVPEVAAVRTGKPKGPKR